MKTKLLIENISKEFFIEKQIFEDDVKIKQLSQNYLFIKAGLKNIEITYDLDERGNITIYKNGKIYQCKIVHEFFENELVKKTKVSKEVFVHSPMPGFVSRIKVEVGKQVKKGDGLLVIEAMKMENEIKAPISGTVININIEAGKPVEKNFLLVTIKGD